MTDKVKQVIWVFDIEENKKKRINLQTLLNRANHSFRHENIKYFALEKDRDEFAKDCRSWSLVKRGPGWFIQKGAKQQAASFKLDNYSMKDYIGYYEN